MQKTMIAAAMSAVLVAGIAWAQDHEEFEKWMKETNAGFARRAEASNRLFSASEVRKCSLTTLKP